MDSKVVYIIIAVVVVVGGLPLFSLVKDGLNAPPPPDDNAKVKQLQQAVDKYADETGYYPNALQDLAPTQLASIPKSDSGQNFRYNASSGLVSVPAERARKQGGPSGSMGEVMTGMGIADELNY